MLAVAIILLLVVVVLCGDDGISFFSCTGSDIGGGGCGCGVTGSGDITTTVQWRIFLILLADL